MAYTYTVLPDGKEPCVARSDGVGIPDDPNNVDCALFLQEWAAGAQVRRVNGTPFHDNPHNRQLLKLGP
jgi:hypothetical protein